ncbi:hypothetical protein LIER_28084 [Lithospermum erythrorhizon]|uniref:Myb-like domain-containing protein n=1 Tax=Lithospermum erythrorhizon TaxID=34254 RepID=A0AAV3REE0_LITER
MLGVSGLAGNTTTHPADTSIDGGGTAAGGGEAHQESGGCIMEFGGAVEGEQRGASGGNRWPRQETMALLKIRSEMDAAFRDSSLKGPLWEEISRKMMELGYKRNPKKCREKFENVFKYHKRTKEGRSSKSEGKTYKFFDQLAALENVTTPPSQSSLHHLPPPPPPPPHSMVAQMQVVHADPISVLPPAPRATTPPNATAAQPSHHHHQEQHYTNVSSSTSSDEDMERRRKRKRTEEEYFREAMKGVIDKQEELQKKFLDILEKKERERMIREEAWRNQELERIKREYDLLAQERSMAAKRHSTLVSFLEKMTQQQNPQYSTREMNISPSLQEKTVKNQCETGFSITKDNTVVNSSFMTIYDGSTRTAAVPQPTFTPTTLPPPSFPPPQLALTLTPTPPTIAPQPALQTPPLPAAVSPPPVMVPPPLVVAPIVSAQQDHNGGGESSMSTTPSSRWPKDEIEALIKIRTSLDNKYQENGPKGPLWEEVSIEMNKLGYKRSSKRCKEKWENINKYFKKVKDNNKKRSEASKTCPYFHQLDALYKEKAKGGGNSNPTTSDLNYSSYENAVNPMIHVVGRPEEDPERGDVEYEDGEGDGHE